MAYVAVNEDGSEIICKFLPIRHKEEILKAVSYNCWEVTGEIELWIDKDHYVSNLTIIPLPKGSIKKLIGRELTWADEPIKLK